MQSRTYTGAPGTAAAGFTAYEYRIDLRNAHKYTDCIAGAVMTPSSIGADGAINPGI